MSFHLITVTSEFVIMAVIGEVDICRLAEDF